MAAKKKTTTSKKKKITAENQKFAKFIGKIREEKGYSQEDMAEVLHISQSTYQRIESGVNAPSFATVLKTLSDLKVALSDIITTPEIQDPQDYKSKWHLSQITNIDLQLDKARLEYQAAELQCKIKSICSNLAASRDIYVMV